MQELKDLPERVERMEAGLRTEHIRIGVQESQNLTKGLHAEAMAAVAALDTSIRRDLGAKLDQIPALQKDSSA